MSLDYRIIQLLGREVLMPHHPKSCVCLGRPHYFGVDKETSRLCAEFNLNGEQLMNGQYRRRFADDILKAFGIQRLEHMDVFREEGATIIHDLNLPTDEVLRNQFEVVLDNGTLEHVFNLPQALENCASLCAVEGHVIIISPANNFCGHGFFQFSPELFYRTFSESNGFSQARVQLLEYGVRNRTFSVVDSAIRKTRLEFINSSQVLMVGIARKTRDKKPFWTQWPQQSDYVVYWNTPEMRPELEHAAPKLQIMLLSAFPRLGRILQGLKYSGFNPKMRLRSNS